MFGRVQQGNAQGGGGGGGRVCSFYQQGRCRFGDNCKFEHPGANKPQDSGNRFQALGNHGDSFNQGNRNNQRPAPARGQQYTSTYQVTKDGIEGDLKNEKPQWPFSAYGPGRDAPIQLFGGFPLEQSPEEMRVLCYKAAANGNPQSAIQAEQELITQITQQVGQILSDLDGAVKYVLDGENQHPNRIDGCQAAVGNVFHKGRKMNSKFSPNMAAQPVNQSAQTGAFGQPTAMGGGGAFGQPSNLGGGGGGFGQASNLGQKPNPFGQPASAAPAAGAFGSPSALGQKPSFGQPAAGGFGQPSAMGAKPNPFGQTAAAPAGAFGQPSTLGQGGAFGQSSGATQASPFIQTAQPNQAQPSPFGQAAQQGGAFGQASAFGQPTTVGQQQNSAFGQSSSLGQQPQPAFGQPAFGQPSASAPQNTAFGQPSTAGQATPFGQAAANVPVPAPTPQNGVFGQPSVPAQQQSTFGKPSPFAQAQGNQQQPQSPFAQAAAKPNPFGQPTQPTQPANNQTLCNPFGTAGQAQPQSQQQQPQQPQQQQQQSYAEPVPQGDWITRQPNGQLKSFKGAPVQYLTTNEAVPTQAPHYRKANGQMERIWHPEGNAAPRTEIEAPAEAYTAEHEAAYKFVAEQGVFKGGIMPELPPKCEWIRTGHGVINGLLVLLGYLVQLLRSIVFVSRKVDTRQKEDDDEDKSNEEMVLLGSSETHPRLLRCLSSGPPIVLEHAPLGTVYALLSSKTPYPPLSHPSIPNRHASLALPLSWLLQTSSALRFLHDQKVTHGAISPSSLFIRHDMSIAVADFTKSTINGHNNGVPTRAPTEFAFPVDALRYDYFDGELSANSQALGLAIDAFDFATLAYKLLLRKPPQWELPTGNGTWALEELHEALDEAAPELGDEIVVGYVARDAWCLVYEEGKTLQEDVVHA
ncbi:hypothetical protein E4T45_08793, partial [Aureobasidium sp. EXF-8846]